MTLPRSVRLALIVGIAGAAGAGMASAQTVHDLFDAHTMQELRLVMNSRDLQELRERFSENIYYPADLQWRDLRVRNVGIRLRGRGSRSAAKPGLRIDFNRYSEGQTLLGLKSIVLDNLVQDPALVRERVAMSFFDHLGQPAPRESFCRLYINNEYQGVYAIVESIDSEFLSRTLGHGDGYLFEYKWQGPFFGSELGEDASAYKPLFEAETHKHEADAILYSPIRDLFHEANQPVDAMWRERVERYLDLEQFVTHVAIETFLSEADGVIGSAGMNNFYLYRDDDVAPQRVMPWDKDRAFWQIDSPILLRADENVLFSRALAFGDLRSVYLNVLEECARAAVEGHWLENEIARASALVDAAAHEDVSKPYANDVYEASVEFLKKFARERPAFVLEDIARARRLSSSR